MKTLFRPIGCLTVISIAINSCAYMNNFNKLSQISLKSKLIKITLNISEYLLVLT